MAGTIMLCGAFAQAQNAKLSAAPPVTYANRYELYAGINFLNTQAGQDIPYRANLGGVEVLGTRWLTRKLGVGAEFRGEAGTTPVIASPISQSGVTRPLIYQIWGMGGVEYRGPGNQLAAINYHAFAGAAHGVFNTQTEALPFNVGLYSDRTRPIFALGGSLDLNRSRKIAIRISPDLILEHWGTETRTFFSIGGGLLYRFGKN
ncbi:hypothetical protein FTO74_12990 [Granulicella sp. WH15]|uniref:hypothetical protein n=1 Tax=Granulicella sp. WH15 TaxID=2602070 RepID=UPI001366E4C3|nr:hypothetical protein [Granulicella sp. WH15]QHN04180.1 hypothetical protein FTO74_12990 [Granulicella sp. WH15]